MKLSRFLYVFFVLCLASSLVLPVFANSEAAAQDIIDAYTYNRETSLEEYGLTQWELEKLVDELYYSGKLPWYATSGCEFSYIGDRRRITSITPQNLENTDMAAYEQRVSEILASCVKPGMSQYQIALSIHDYLVLHSAYDLSETKNSGYALLVDGTAVCSGYALAYMDLLTRAGLECRFVVSQEMDHGWNLVKIGESWYHVDVTWDDPSPNSQGHVAHHYFLLTDEEIQAGEAPHYGWETDIVCNDTQFQDGFWRDISSAIHYESSEACYLVRGGISPDYNSALYRRDAKGQETLLYRQADCTADIGQGPYYYPHRGLSLEGGRLWLTAPDRVISMNPDGTDQRTEYTHRGSTYLYGALASADTLHLTLSAHDGTLSETTASLAAAPVHRCSFTVTTVPPTCSAPGYTLSVCSCGLEAKSAPTEALDHDYVVQSSQTATLFHGGYRNSVCAVCGQEEQLHFAQLDLISFVKENISLLLLFAAFAWLIHTAVKSAKKKKVRTQG